MSRHRKVKALDYDDEYDEYYGEYDDDDGDFDGEAFEAQYLSSGIDLNSSKSNNTSSKVNNSSSSSSSRQTLIDEARLGSIEQYNAEVGFISGVPLALLNDIAVDGSNSRGTILSSTPSTTELSSSATTSEQKIHIDSITSDLTRIAILHLDKHQWQLPLMEMDKKFRDKTYYRHYTDTYISSLRSKLGHFLADNQLISNPMKYHLQQELDNYSKYSRMFELLTDYYQSLGGGFFSFATPSPDEEIVIGCRLGTKAKKQAPKLSQPSKNVSQQKAARFEYQGKPNNSKSSSSKNNSHTNTKPVAVPPKNDQMSDMTIQENFTAEQLNKLSEKYRESLHIVSNKKDVANKAAFEVKARPSGSSTKTSAEQPQSQNKTSIATSKKPNSVQAAKQLVTLAEKRHDLRQQLKRNAQPSDQDRETFKRQALQTTKEYNELIKSSRPRVNLITVGHVDAGKSTLVGHLLFRLGQISSKQMHRFEVDSQKSGKASFKFAWAMDETDQERARGLTIDIAFTQFETPNRDIVLLDAPGHVDFVPAVISGAAQADAALLVVDATRGEFETGFESGGQTKEHTFLVRSLGVKSLVVVVNKMDNVDWNWNRFNDIVEQLKPFLKQVGFNLKDDVQFVACSGLTGANMVDRRIEKQKKQSSHPQLEGDGGNWSSIPSLIEAIDKIKQPDRLVDKPTRVCVTDVFKGMSSGVFLGGKVVGGKIENKQKLLLLPPNENCEIKQVEVRSSKSTRAFAGDIVTIVASGIDINKYYRGCMLCDPLIPCQVTNRFQARIILFQGSNTILVKGTPIEVHINGIFEEGEVRKLISLLNKNTGELIQRKPRCIAKNSSAVIQLKLRRQVCCELYEDNKDLGRFMMRSYGQTIAAGLITKIKSPKLPKNLTKMKSK